MSRLDTHLRRYREFRAVAQAAKYPSAKVEMWFLSAYHLIEACAAKSRVHILKHQRVPDELRRSPAIVGGTAEEVAAAFLYLDHEARAKFVYGATGTAADLARARKAFEAIESRCLEVLR